MESRRARRDRADHHQRHESKSPRKVGFRQSDFQLPFFELNRSVRAPVHVRVSTLSCEVGTAIHQRRMLTGSFELNVSSRTKRAVFDTPRDLAVKPTPATCPTASRPPPTWSNAHASYGPSAPGSIGSAPSVATTTRPSRVRSAASSPDRSARPAQQIPADRTAQASNQKSPALVRL